MHMSDKEQLLDLALRVGKKAADLLSARPDVLEVSTKSSDVDIVTQMDKAAEALIVSSILAERPSDGMIGEEGANRESTSGITWVIDPLDGTVNYFYGLPGWNVSIAAKDKDGVVVGVVFSPTINSTWWATRGGGSFHNGKKIKCRDSSELSRALLATGFAYESEKRTFQLQFINTLLPKMRDIRRVGAAAVDLSFVGAGNVDAYFESGLNEWDLAAGGLIAQEAGAIVTQHQVGDHNFTLAAGPHLHQILKNTLGL
jgi:myo-inositol-1(or 4)-monophosphatase